jgi:hypothetical protein
MLILMSFTLLRVFEIPGIGIGDFLILMLHALEPRLLRDLAVYRISSAICCVSQHAAIVVCFLCCSPKQKTHDLQPWPPPPPRP